MILVPFRLDLTLPDEAATLRLGADLARLLEPGDTVLLEGSLGAGKSALARSLIRALAGAEIEVPSPTFTLIQSYDSLPKPVAHLDLYRLSGPEDLDELGLDDLQPSHIRLIEWPERLGGGVAIGHCLTIRLAIAGSGRRASLTATPDLAPRLARFAAAERLITAAGFGDAARCALAADASSRRFTRLMRGDGARAVLMDMPARSGEPAVRDGLPYSAIAHIATDCEAVVTVNAELTGHGYSAPQTFGADLKEGFVLMEDLGDSTFASMIARGEDMDEPMRETVRLLARMALEEWPHSVPAYDLDALLIETSLLIDWYAPQAAPARAEFTALWSEHLTPVLPARPVWTLRDVHAANLLWLPERDGVARVGLVDTQDCVLGHPAYDLVSLLQDARVEISAARERELLADYGPSTAFLHAYAVYGAQRATKILGIFTRLAARDGKTGYLALRPHVARLLARNLAHPALQRLRAWYEAHLPEIFA